MGIRKPPESTAIVRREIPGEIVRERKTDSLVARFRRALRAFSSSDPKAEQDTVTRQPQVYSRIQSAYPTIAGGFEAGIERILMARAGENGTLDFEDSRTLAKDVADLLISLVKRWSREQRQSAIDPDSDALVNVVTTSLHYGERVDGAKTLMVTLKTIVLERARAVFDEESRKRFADSLEHRLFLDFKTYKLD